MDVNETPWELSEDDTADLSEMQVNRRYVLARVFTFNRPRRFFRVSARTQNVLCMVVGECPEDGLMYVRPVRQGIQPQVIMKSQVIKYI